MVKVKVYIKYSDKEEGLIEYESDYIPNAGEEWSYESDSREINYAIVVRRQVTETDINGERETIVKLNVVEDVW